MKTLTSSSIDFQGYTECQHSGSIGVKTLNIFTGSFNVVIITSTHLPLAGI